MKWRQSSVKHRARLETEPTDGLGETARIGWAGGGATTTQDVSGGKIGWAKVFLGAAEGLSRKCETCFLQSKQDSSVDLTRPNNIIQFRYFVL